MGEMNGVATGKTVYRNLKEYAAAKCLPVSFLDIEGLHDIPGGGIGITYYSEDGQQLFVKTRGVPGGRRFDHPKGLGLSAYGLWKLADRASDTMLYITEGESDTLTLWYHGLHAIGLPGRDSTSCLNAETLIGIEQVYIVQHNDEAGEGFVGNVNRRLSLIGYRGRVAKVILPDSVNDASDLHIRSPDAFPEDFRRLTGSSVPLRLDPTKKPAASGKPSAMPAPTEPWQPFPVHALPRAMAAIVREGANALGCDAVYLAMPALAAAAAAIGNSRAIKLKRTWQEPAIVWAGVIGESGTLKTPAFRAILSPVWRIQREMIDNHRLQIASWKDQHDAWQERAREAKRNGDEAPTEPKRPTQQRVICGDVTIEKLAEVLEDNPRGVLVARDELAGWLGSFTRYKGKGGGSDLPNWLEMHSAGTILVDRKTGERRLICVEHASTSVAGGIQPGVLARVLTNDFYESGLTARILLAWPPRHAKIWREDEISETTEQAWGSLLEKCLKLNMRQTDRSGLLPGRVCLSAQAKTLWVEFFNSWADEQAAVDGELASSFSKIEGYAARFALIHHVVTMLDLEMDENREIQPASMEAAITLARWFARETRRIYAALGETVDERDTRRLIEWIQAQGGKTTVKNLQRSRGSRYPTSMAADTALEVLVGAGLGHWQDVPPGPQGGRPTRLFVLVPTLPTIAETDETSQVGIVGGSDETSGSDDETLYG